MNSKRILRLAFICFIATLGIAPVQGAVPHEVLAFYYPWYGLSASGDHGNHWGKINAHEHYTPNISHFPERGAYNSHDSALIDSHIAQAQSNGITGFIVSWWGQKSFEDNNFPAVLKGAEKVGFKVSAFWEKAPGKGQAQIDQAIDDLAYLVSKFGSSKAFLKVDGKPVIFVYERVTAELPLSSWPSIISRARAKAGPFLLIGDGYDEKHARLFDGLSRYNISWAAAGKSVPYIRAWAAKFDANAVRLARQYNRISCATVIPGYDDRKVNKPGRLADRQDGQVYSALWEEAIKARPDWVVIASWNEWHEGTEIEPSIEDHDKYLKLTAEYTQRFMGNGAK